MQLSKGRRIVWNWSDFVTDTCPAIVNTDDGSLICRLQGHTDYVRGCKELSTGKLATWSNDGTVRVWNPQTGDCAATLEGHSKYVSGIHEIGNKRLVSLSADGSIRLWDLESEQEGRIVYEDPGNSHIYLKLCTKDYLVITSGLNLKPLLVVELSTGKVATHAKANSFHVYAYDDAHYICVNRAHPRGWVVELVAYSSGKRLYEFNDEAVGRALFQDLVKLDDHRLAVFYRPYEPFFTEEGSPPEYYYPTPELRVFLLDVNQKETEELTFLGADPVGDSWIEGGAAYIALEDFRLAEIRTDPFRVSPIDTISGRVNDGYWSFVPGGARRDDGRFISAGKAAEGQAGEHRSTGSAEPELKIHVLTLSDCGAKKLEYEFFSLIESHYDSFALEESGDFLVQSKPDLFQIWSPNGGRFETVTTEEDPDIRARYDLARANSATSKVSALQALLEDRGHHIVRRQEGLFIEEEDTDKTLQKLDTYEDHGLWGVYVTTNDWLITWSRGSVRSLALNDYAPGYELVDPEDWGPGKGRVVPLSTGGVLLFAGYYTFDNRILIWNGTNQLFVLLGHPNEITNCLEMPDGSILSCDSEDTVFQWRPPEFGNC
jgi:WD40 repeat protein